MSERPGPSSENDIGLVIKKARDKTLYVLFLNGRVSPMYEDDTIPVEVSKKTITSFSDMLLELGARVGLLRDGYCHNKVKIYKLIDEYMENNGIDKQSDKVEEKISEFLADLQARKPELFQNAEEAFTEDSIGTAKKRLPIRDRVNRLNDAAQIARNGFIPRLIQAGRDADERGPEEF